MAKRVRDYMTTQVEVLTPSSTMEEAVLLQRRRHIRHIPIVDNGKLVGIVTDRDTKRAMPSLLTGTDQQTYERILRATPVERIMTRSPLVTSADAPLREAVRTISERKIGALPVVDRGALVGILTETDVLRAFLEMLDREG